MHIKEPGLALALIAISMLLGGCGRGNGLPDDLTAHLTGRGISVRILGFKAPLSSRAGFVFFDPDPDLEVKIIAEFHLKKIEQEDRQFDFIAARIAGKPKALWGISGRPARLKLKNGAQFEYLYLLTTEDGRTYVLAEYSYG